MTDEGSCTVTCAACGWSYLWTATDLSPADFDGFSCDHKGCKRRPGWTPPEPPPGMKQEIRLFHNGWRGWKNSLAIVNDITTFAYLEAQRRRHA